jgi:hypothetical protein
MVRKEQARHAHGGTGWGSARVSPVQLLRGTQLDYSARAGAAPGGCASD